MRNSKTYSEAGKLGAIASLKTHNERKQKRIEEYNLSPTKCKHCGKVLDYEHRNNKFCCCSCAASFNNIGVVRKVSLIQKNRVCGFCGIELKKRSQKHFCSNSCQQKFIWQNTKDKIEKTGCFEVGFGNEASRKLVKRYLIEKYGHKCSICGISEWMGKEAPLVVDHIDGDATNCRVDNFRLVCGNCDMQLPTYKRRNKIGRKWRNKYKIN